jgi:hypothetical protein
MKAEWGAGGVTGVDKSGRGWTNVDNSGRGWAGLMGVTGEGMEMGGMGNFG